MKIIGLSGILGLAAVLVLIPYLVLGQATVTIDPSVTHQKINGWEGTDTLGEIDQPNAFLKWRDAAVDRLVNELGITRVRLEINAGLENPVDYFSQYLSGKLDYKTWESHWFQAINDNSDPSVINQAGFQFSMLDFKIDNTVVPIRQAVAANGEKLFVNLEYITGDPAAGGPAPLHSTNPNEYAEFMLAVFKHMQLKYGWVPDQVEICNEPSGGRGWSPSILANNLVATGKLLNANGFHPDFAGPSNADVGGAIDWFNQMRSVPDLLNYMKEFSFHRYGGDWLSNIQKIGTFPALYRVRTAMLEKFDGGGTYLTLHEDLKHGNVSAWQQYALAYPTDDNGAQYYWIDRSNPASPKVNMGTRTRFLRQYFRFIRPGAQRIEAATSNPAFDAVAFLNLDGGAVVVVRADAGGSIAIGGLPAGTYAATYTTNSEYNVKSSGKAVTAGQALTVSIPAAGAITIYRESSDTPPPAPGYSYLPQIANGSNAETSLRTELIFINTGNDGPLTLDFFDSAGQPMSLPFVQYGVQSTLALSLKRGESASIVTSGAGAIQVGYARVQAGPGVRGTAVFTRSSAGGTVLYEAGVPQVSPLPDFTVYFDSLQNKDTGLALVNAAPESPAHVHLRIYDTQFQQKGETSFDLPSRNHRANFIWEFLRDATQLMQLAREGLGIVTVEADQPLAAVALRQDGDPAKAFPLTVPTLTALPVAPGRTGSSTPGPSASSTFYFPQVGHGLDSSVQLETEMILMNTGTADNSVKLDFFESSGQPMALTLKGMGTNSTFQFSLQAGRAVSLLTQGSTGLRVGYARVTATQAVQGTAVFTRRDAPSSIILYEAGIPATAPQTQFSVFLDSIGNRDTGLAMVNSSTTSNANVVVRLYNLALQKLAEIPIVLPPGGHRASFVWEMFQTLPEAADQAREMQGVVTVTSDTPLAAVTIRQNDDPLSDFPASVPTLAVFPVAPGVGLTN